MKIVDTYLSKSYINSITTNDIIDKAQNNKNVSKICSHQRKESIEILVSTKICLSRKCQYIFSNNIVWNINYGAPDESRSNTLNNFNESVQFRTIMSSVRNTSRICRSSYVCVSDHRFRHECLGKIIEQHTQ